MKINDIIINILFYGSEDDKKIIKNSLELSTDFNFKITCKSGIEEIINHIQESTYDIIIFKIAFAKDTEINNLSKILTHIETPAIIITDDIKSLSKNKFIFHSFYFGFAPITFCGTMPPSLSLLQLKEGQSIMTIMNSCHLGKFSLLKNTAHFKYHVSPSPLSQNVTPKLKSFSVIIHHCTRNIYNKNISAFKN